jgi:hypothetical protein
MEFVIFSHEKAHRDLACRKQLRLTFGADDARQVVKVCAFCQAAVLSWKYETITLNVMVHHDAINTLLKQTQARGFIENSFGVVLIDHVLD